MRALSDQESIILIKGPRQIGKTSLQAQGVQKVKALGWRHALTDFQKLNSAQMASDDIFYKLLSATLARQFKFKYDFGSEWLDLFRPNLNMENFLRELLDAADEPLVWFIELMRWTRCSAPRSLAISSVWFAPGTTPARPSRAAPGAS